MGYERLIKSPVDGVVGGVVTLEFLAGVGDGGPVILGRFG